MPAGGIAVTTGTHRCRLVTGLGYPTWLVDGDVAGVMRTLPLARAGHRGPAASGGGTGTPGGGRALQR